MRPECYEETMQEISKEIIKVSKEVAPSHSKLCELLEGLQKDVRKYKNDMDT